MSTTSGTRPFAIVTGASSGIGYELAKLCAEHGYDLLIAADRPLQAAAQTLRQAGASVETVETDLAKEAGCDRLIGAANGRRVDALLANAGLGLGHAFLDQPFDQVRHIIDTNITGTLYLIQRLVRDMVARHQGRVLITGSVAGYMPGSFQAVYNGTKAFIDSFSYALRNEIKDTGVTITLLMPGATETEFFERAGLMDTNIGESKKDDPAMVAKVGFDAMMNGEADVVAGWKNKIQSTVANVTPNEVLAEMHRKKAEPRATAHDKPPKR